MIQETIKTQMKQVQAFADKLQEQVRPQLEKANQEGKRVLKQLGAEVGESDSLSQIFAQIREHNPTLKQLIFNIDAATYDARKQLSWNANMMSAYAVMEAEKAYAKQVKPTLTRYAESVEAQIKQLTDKAIDLKAKVLN